MSSQMKSASPAVRALSSLDGSVAELPKNGSTKTTKRAASQDNVETNCGESSIISHARTTSSATNTKPTPFSQRNVEKKLPNLPNGFNPSTFTLPPPPPVQHPFPNNVSCDPAQNSTERIRHALHGAHSTLVILQQPAAVPITKSSMQPHVSDVGAHTEISARDGGSQHVSPEAPSKPSISISGDSMATKASYTEAQERRMQPVIKEEGKRRTNSTHQELPTKTTQTENLYIAAKSPHYVGQPWRPLPVKPLTTIPLPPPTSELERSRMSWCHTLHRTSSFDDAWNAYTELVNHSFSVHRTLLHRMVRIIARQPSKAHREYVCLLAILKHLRASGGIIHLHEWNILINVAGRGLRKPTVKQYEAALSFFRDMTKGRAPGTTLDLDSGSVHDENIETAEPVKPDIYTYTTLLAIASRTQDIKCLRHARALFERSGIPPNRFTHLAFLPYFSSTGQPGAIRSTLLRLERDNMQLGLDGVNALLSAYSSNKRLDVVMMIYRLLKHNLTPNVEDESENERLNEYRRQLTTEEFIEVPDYLVPNEVTYTSMVQIMSYHGHLSAALTILTDMLTTLNTERGAPLIRDADGTLKPARYQATSAVFRALFLGFRRYVVNLPKEGRMRLHERDTTSLSETTETEYTLHNLQHVFDLFMRMPPEVQVGPSAFYWVVMAFQRISGGDLELVRDVWRQLEGRFKGSLGGKDNRLRRLKMTLFPEDSE